MAALRNRDPHKLFDGHAVAHVVDERRNVIEPVGVRHHAVVVDVFGHLLEVAVKVPDLDFGMVDPFAVELRHNSDDPVHRRMRGTDVEKHVSRLEIRVVQRFEVCCLDRHS